MGMSRALTDAQALEARSRYLNGEPAKSIATTLGVSYDTVTDAVWGERAYRHLRLGDQEVEALLARSSHQNLEPEKKEAIRAAVKGEMELPDYFRLVATRLAEALGTSPPTVSNYVSKYRAELDGGPDG